MSILAFKCMMFSRTLGRHSESPRLTIVYHRQPRARYEVAVLMAVAEHPLDGISSTPREEQKRKLTPVVTLRYCEALMRFVGSITFGLDDWISKGIEKTDAIAQLCWYNSWFRAVRAVRELIK
mmetsp:Transcript_18889/g.32499  ORF Transcript_18889/g.32499 Transcript_18889/m.32499 type:complete len:123 (+) Transcript_18889:238-606(+)